MAINKKLIHFQTMANFEAQLSAGNILDTSIVFIKDAKKIWTHGEFYDCSDVDTSHLLKREEAKNVIQGIYDLLASHNKELKFFAVETVTVKVDNVDHVCNPNEITTVFVGDKDFEIIPTSNNSIKELLGYPIPLTWYDWLEGVDVFENIIFDMNGLDTYKHWSQGYQGQYHVQFAQYVNCIFWSDNPYISTLTERTNYTLYASAELPLCYSTIRENTYKAFYFAYGVTLDPNWYNDDYLYSFSLANYATQTWSYYGARTIGVFNSAVKPIALPKDCRGLLFASPTIESVGVLDASKVTDFGAKSGSWRDAFGYCSSLKNLYIKYLKASINVSWSPINFESIEYIVSNASNTNKIYLYVSSYTWFRLTDAIKQTALSKNIEIQLLEGNYKDDNRINSKQDILVSGSNIKTIDNESILGEGNIKSKLTCVDYTPSVGELVILRPGTYSYHTISKPINDIYVFLPNLLTPVTYVEHIMLNVKFGSTPNIQFIPGAGYGGTVRAAEGFSVEPDSWYEISIINAGNGWIVSNIKLNDAIINPFLPSGNPTAVSSEEDELDIVEEQI